MSELKDAIHSALQESDSQLARVTEDLINLLVEKKVILFTELPEAVQRKLVERESLRLQLRDEGASILSEDDTI